VTLCARATLLASSSAGVTLPEEIGIPSGSGARGCYGEPRARGRPVGRFRSGEVSNDGMM
jgi:hypothetical protein